jgi:hypothetical protein
MCLSPFICIFLEHYSDFFSQTLADKFSLLSLILYSKKDINAPLSAC